MKLLFSGAALTAAIVLPAAPAAASSKPVDFELAAPAAASVASSGPVVSPRLATPRRFNLVGMRWRGAAEPVISLRVRRRGRWSRWQELAAHADHNPDPRDGERLAAASDPLWVGSAEAVQYRMSRRVPGLRLHFVNVGRRPRTRLRAAQSVGPAYVTRAQWGASGCKPREEPLYGEVKAVHVHHTVSLNDYTRAEAPAIVLAICRYHRNSNGWNDIGYNALVDKFGVLYEGRAGGMDEAVVGAQAQGFNAQTAGIASIGDHTSVAASPATLGALARYIAWKLAVHAQPLGGRVTLTSAGGSESRYGPGARVTVQRVLGHRDTGRTACPGAELYAQLPQLRAMVASSDPGVPPSTARLSAALARYSAEFGESVPLSGLLAGPDGLPLAAAPVEVQTNSEGAWQTAKVLTTSADGSFNGELRPRKRMYVRLSYPGATFNPLLLRLHPVVQLRRPPRTASAGRRVRLFGTVAPRKRTVNLRLQQRIRGRFRTVGAKAVRARAGRFSTSFVPAFRAAYRYAVVVRSDDDTDRGTTGWRPLRVR